MWRSNCCGALPMWDAVHDHDGEHYGLCSDCAEHTDFYWEDIEKDY